MSSLCSYSTINLSLCSSYSFLAFLPLIILLSISKSPRESLTSLLFKSSVIVLHHYGSLAFSTNLAISSFSGIFSTCLPLTPYPLWSYKSYHSFGMLPTLSKFSSSDESSESRRLISYFSSSSIFSFSWSSLVFYWSRARISDFFIFCLSVFVEEEMSFVDFSIFET